MALLERDHLQKANNELHAALENLTKHLMVSDLELEAQWNVYQLNVGHIRAARAALASNKP